MGLIMSILDAAGRAIAKPNADEAEVDVLSEGDDSDEALVNWTEGGKKKSATGKVAKSTLAQMTLETVSIPQNFAGLESISTPTRLRYQIFTIVSVDEQDDYVEVVANHIFYEQATNYTVWTPETLVNYSCGAICRNVMANTINGDEGFKVATDCTEQLPWHQIDYARKNLIEAFLDPENGICRRFNLNLVRDNMNFYVLKNVGYDRGFVIEDKKNLLGVQRQENIENTVTRIAAYGKDKDGNILWLNNNGKKYVDSQYISNYKHPRVEIYDTGVQITGDKEAELLHNQGRDSEIVTAENINAKIYNAAVKRFTEDHVDDPEVTMKVDFVSLGDTEEYKQYRDLDKVYLYDIVHVKHSGRDYSYGAQVIGVEHDILTGMLLSVTIGNIVSWDGIRKVANWQVPEIDGSIIRMHSITASQYDYGSITGSAIRDESISGNHINVPSVSQALNVDQLKSILAQAGLVLGDDGILIYKNSDDNMFAAKLQVQADRITAEVERATGAESSVSGKLEVEAGKVAMVVGTNSGGNFIKAAEIATAINDAGEGIATINAAHVNISATNTLHTLAGAVEQDDQGHLTIKSAGGMRVRRTEQGITSEFGVFDNGNLTAGVIVDKVNNGSVTLKGSKVWVGDSATDQTLKKWATESDGLFAQNIGALSARIGTIEADYIRTQNLSSEIANISSLSVQNVNFASMTSSRGGVSAYSGAFTNFSLAGVSMTTSDVVKSVVGSTVTGGGYKFTVTMLNGTSVDYPFDVASSITLSGAWTGASYTATAKDQDDNVVGTVSTSISRDWSGTTLRIVSGTDVLLSEAITGGTGAGMSTQGTLYTINSFNSSHRAYGYVDAASHPAGRLFSFNVDASSVYAEGEEDGWEDAVAEIVWPSAGDGQSFVVGFKATPDATVTNRTFTMAKGTPGVSGYASVNYHNQAVAKIDISNWYTSGQSAGYAEARLEFRPDSHEENTSTKRITILNSAGDTVYGPVSIEDTYDAGADSVTLTPGWQGSTFTVTASNGATSSTTIATGSGQNGWVLSNDRIYHHVYADGAARLSDDYDLSSYKATQRAAGAASVTVSAAGWQGGSNVVSASNGESVTISMPAVTLSSSNWVSHKKTVYAYSSAAGIQGYIASHEVDATDEYNAGWLAYYNSSKWQRPRAGNGGVCAIPNTTPDGAIRTWFTVTVTTSQTYNSTDHTYTATGTAYDGSAAIASGSSTTGTEAYTAGYNKGWDDAVAKMSRSGANIYGPSASSRGSSELWYAVTVVQGSIGATRVTSSQYTLKASATAYINRVSVATDSTSRGLTV